MTGAEVDDIGPDVALARTRRERKRLAWQGKACQNCNVPLRGPFCHQCGQPEKTPIRDLVSLSTDAFDYLFDVDARVWRTLVSLFFVRASARRIEEGETRRIDLTFRARVQL